MKKIMIITITICVLALFLIAGCKKQVSDEELRYCESDAECVPFPECHPMTCINEKYEDYYKKTQRCTQIFILEAAYNAEDCLCIENKCTNINLDKNKQDKPIACTEDARVCDDGSVVVRDPDNNCEFPACPETEETFCKPEQRNAEICTMEYRPVCGWANENIQCLKYPCASTYSNPCMACSDENVEYWTEGECPAGENCAQEGETFSGVFVDEYPEHCCGGLTEWNSGMDTQISIGSKCYPTGYVSGSPTGTCINCGNGICEDIETACNCPDDCDGTEKSRYMVYTSVADFCEKGYDRFCKNLDEGVFVGEHPLKEVCDQCPE